MSRNSLDVEKWLGIIPGKVHVNIDEHLDLTMKQTLIFELLRSRDGVSRKQLREELWQGTYVSDQTIDVHICNLRKKLHGKYLIKIKGPGTWKMQKEC